jgi:hypothetical protein
VALPERVRASTAAPAHQQMANSEQSHCVPCFTRSKLACTLEAESHGAASVVKWKSCVAATPWQQQRPMLLLLLLLLLSKVK